MRSDILRLVEAFPDARQTQIGGFFDENVGPYLDALVRDGMLVVETEKTGLSGRPARRFRVAMAEGEVVPVSDRHAGAHCRAKLQVAKWMMSLSADPITQEVLAELMSAPATWARERPLADLMARCGIEEGGKGWMRSAKKLAGMGVLELRARKGAGRWTTCWLKEPPPYPMG